MFKSPSRCSKSPTTRTLIVGLGCYLIGGSHIPSAIGAFAIVVAAAPNGRPIRSRRALRRSAAAVTLLLVPIPPLDPATATLVIPLALSAITSQLSFALTLLRLDLQLAFALTLSLLLLLAF